jgi:hypothetical protein
MPFIGIARLETENPALGPLQSAFTLPPCCPVPGIACSEEEGGQASPPDLGGPGRRGNIRGMLVGAAFGLGRALINAQPKTDAGELDEGEVVGGELVVSGRDPTTLLDLVEEPLDQVAVAVEIGAEADRVFTIALGRNIRPCASLGDECPNPVRVVAAICQQPRATRELSQQDRAEPVVMRLTTSEAELHRQTIAVHHYMDLAGQPATRATHLLVAVVGDAGTMLVYADDGGIDHLHRRIVNGSQRIHELVPDARPSPANEAIVASRRGTIPVWQIAPWCARAQDPEDAVENASVVHPGNAAWLVRQHRLDDAPFVITEFIAHDLKLLL